MADGQRRGVVDAGIGANFLSALTGGISTRMQKQQEQENALRQILATALATEQAKNQYDPERIAQTQAIQQADLANPAPKLALSPTATPEQHQLLQSRFQEAQQGRAKRQIDLLKGIGSSRGRALLTPEDFHDRRQATLNAQFEMMPQREDEAARLSAAREAGKFGTKTPPSEQITPIRQTKVAIRQLEELIAEMEQNQFKTGPLSLRFSPGKTAGRYMALVGTKEESAFRKKLQRYQNAYASAQSGAQRGFKEIEWLAGSQPEPDVDQPDQFLNNARNALNELRENQQNMTRFLSESGFRVPQDEPTPAAAASSGQFQDGDTATHPQTGQTLTYRNGQWE